MIAVRELPRFDPAAIERVIREARELAWWSHVNLSRLDLYRGRKEAFARLRAAIDNMPTPPVERGELRYLLLAAIRLASCSDSNRMGVAYYERKAAMAQLRGCLAVYDRVVYGEPAPESATNPGPVLTAYAEDYRRILERGAGR